jgi:CHRD domain
MRAVSNGQTTTFVLNGQTTNSRGDLVSSARRITIICLVAAVGMLLGSVGFASGESGGRPFTIDLTGAAEVTAEGVPNQGDPDGSGTANLTINPGTGEVCWTIEVADVDPIIMAHIHSGASTTTGPIVVPLNPYTGACTEVPRELALAIITDPSAYYVNVHSMAYRGGAMRGQLTFAR